MKTTQNISKNILKLQMKPLDFVLIITLMLASFTPFLFFSNNQKPSNIAQLRINGKIIKNFDLTENQNYTYKDTDGDINKIVVRDGKIGIIYATCADQICVRKGFVDKSGQTIICLPHQLVIEVMSDNKKNKERVVDYE
ncbi:protein export element [Lactococcus hodotermopsidis]|uniref:Protein export element n=1 Tax=Pseudolactococcus hodotermopsidis TaxID=2709157 RepID=A0A6A0BFS4_9LACT|nr:NusG domain II-containing protein [Lactococcus hodotermopsidis]GFH43198.1 protein export element [Lactococcus hodotermopsidis]